MVIGIVGLEKGISKAAELSGIDVMKVVMQQGRKVQKSAKDIVPVGKTGNLKGSIKRKSYKDQLSTVIYTILEYAPYVEYGTRKMKAQPFLLPALKENEESIKEAFREFTDNDIKRIVRK